jgi:hypothetical protein
LRNSLQDAKDAKRKDETTRVKNKKTLRALSASAVNNPTGNVTAKAQKTQSGKMKLSLHD